MAECGFDPRNVEYAGLIAHNTYLNGNLGIGTTAPGSRTITLDTNFRLGSTISSVTLSTAVNKVDYIGAVYDATDGKWDVIAYSKGY